MPKNWRHLRLLHRAESSRNCTSRKGGTSAGKEETPRQEAKYRWARRLLPVAGLLSLVWFLVRVIPKPSRATYPCQRVALPFASGFVIWLLGLGSSVAAFRTAKRCFARAHYVVGLLCILASVGIVWLLVGTAEDEIILAAAQVPNAPIGVGKGIHPGRVVWIHDANATDWDGYHSPERWYDSEHTDQTVVHRMVSRAIRGLAGECTDVAAWDAIFRRFNSARGKADVGYTPGEKIAIKINNTLCYNASSSTFEQRSSNKNRIDNSPQLTVALLWQLVNVVGVAEADITIGDPGRITPNFLYDIVQPQFPNICYMANLGGKTVLYLVDGLFAGQNWYSQPTKWGIPPFLGDWPSSILVSQDAVAIDSVCYDFLWIEWPDHSRMSGADDYLHEAALADSPPSGTFYDLEADGVRLASLGVHEHWNNPIDKQYSRNLGTGDGIELTRPAACDFNGDGAVGCADLMTLSAQWLQASDRLSCDIAHGPCGDGIVDMQDFALLARSWSPADR